MSNTIAPKPKTGAVSRARVQRRRMTLPEVVLWQELRKRPAGLKFRRQHPSGPYVLDFFCLEAQLAIEVDGETHNFGARIKHDKARDAWFARAGILTLRVPAQDVLRDCEAVLSSIVRKAGERSPSSHSQEPPGKEPLHRPAGGPPPRDKLGED